MKNYLLPGKKLSILLIFIIPLLLGSSNRTGNSDERFSLINYTVFTPGSDVRINLYSASKTNNYHLRLFKVENAADFFTKINRTYARYNFDVWGSGSDFLLQYTQLIKDWNTPVQSTDYYRSNKNLDLGKIEKPGYYILQALSGEQVAYCGIVVSNLAMVYKNNGRQLLTFVANSSTGDIVKNVKYALYDKNTMLQKENSDKDGLAVFNISDTLSNANRPFLIIARTSDETVLSDPYFYFRTDNNYYTAYIYTNQPVYRPGQQVYFKAVIRQKFGEEYRNIPNEKFSVSIKSPKNKEVYSGSLKTNEFGSLTGNLKLDNEADLGSYSIVLTKDDMTYYGSFDVQEYKKPEYLVKVETAKKQYASGDTVKVSVSADYYFGSPVMSAKVDVKIYRQNYWRPWWYWSDYAWFYQSFAPSRFRNYGKKDLISEQTGVLGNDGKFNYEITAPSKQNDDYIYIISAEVTDNSRNTISGEANVFVTRGSFSITTSPERYFEKKGEPVKLRINTADFSSRPVSTGFRIIVNYPEIKENNISYSRPVSDTLIGKTDTLGKSVVAFIPKILVNGSFKYTVCANDEKGRLITASGSFYVGNINYYYYGGSSNGLEIATDKDSYEKGDSLTAFIFFPHTGMDVLVSYESKDFIGYKVYRVDKNTLTVKIKLTEQYAPSFNIDVTYLKDDQLQHTSKMIGVLDKDKFLTITAVPEKEIYNPGEKVKYNITAKDAKGRPVKNTDLSIGVVDESIYAIKEDETPNIKTFYYAPGYSVIPTYSSLQNSNYNGVSRQATIMDSKTKYHNISPEGTGNLFGRLTLKKEHAKFGNIYLLLSGDKYFYRMESDTSGKYQFSNIKQGDYKLFLLFGDFQIYYFGQIDVHDETSKNIDLSNYSNYILYPGSTSPMLKSFAVNSVEVRAQAKAAPMAEMLSESDALEAKRYVEPRVRNKFSDAAFWDADVITDVNGKAEVSFDLPDNLTTWRTTVRGITNNTLVGQNTDKIISRKNLLIRLETPRFFREGDELNIVDYCS